MVIRDKCERKMRILYKQIGTKFNKTMSLLWMFILLATLNPIKHSYVEGLRTLDKNRFGMKPKGTVKTIEALECGDIIDCIDFYKQPAFDDPLIKGLNVPNLKKDTSLFPSGFNKSGSHQPNLIQIWRKYGECPKGTVPIRRTLDNNGTFHRKSDDPNTREYATVHQHFNKNHGVQAIFNMWNPEVEDDEEFSISQIWITSGRGQHLNTIEVGWMVNYSLYNDKHTRLFTYWTADSYRETGCYNRVCEGFVVTGTEIALGAAVEVSVFNVDAVVIKINLSRHESGDWYLTIEEQIVGYFPASRFTTLADGADTIEFGGEIVNLKKNGRHTRTKMGSGYWPFEGFKRSCFISNIKVRNEHFKWVNPKLKKEAPTNRRCYDVTLGPAGTILGSHIYFGGPGFSRSCP